jgi:hypothetical protein
METCTPCRWRAPTHWSHNCHAPNQCHITKWILLNK